MEPTRVTIEANPQPTYTFDCLNKNKDKNKEPSPDYGPAVDDEMGYYDEYAMNPEMENFMAEMANQLGVDVEDVLTTLTSKTPDKPPPPKEVPETPVKTKPFSFGSFPNSFGGGVKTDEKKEKFKLNFSNTTNNKTTSSKPVDLFPPKLEEASGPVNAETSTISQPKSDKPKLFEEAPKEYTLQPLVSLEKKEVLTGTESETEVFSKRAQLWRLDPTEGENAAYKTRCIGELKMFKHPATGVARMVMREETNKLCRLNFNINSNGSTEVNQAPNKPKKVIWHSVDYSDQEPEKQGRTFTFCAKFAEGETTATEFVQLFNKELHQAPKNSTTEKEDPPASNKNKSKSTLFAKASGSASNSSISKINFTKSGEKSEPGMSSSFSFKDNNKESSPIKGFNLTKQSMGGGLKLGTSDGSKSGSFSGITLDLGGKKQEQ